MTSAHVRTNPIEWFQTHATTDQACIRPRRSALTPVPEPTPRSQPGPWQAQDPDQRREAPEPPTATPPEDRQQPAPPLLGCDERRDGVAPTHQPPCSRPPPPVAQPHPNRLRGRRPDNRGRPSPHDGWCLGIQPRSEAGWRREARGLRRTGARGPWSGARRGWTDRRAYASEAGSRGSSPDDGCWAGRCASWSGSWRL
jgi:hypothetical protein